LEEAGCEILAERIMIYLTLNKGLARNDAHKLVMDAVRSYGNLRKALKEGHALSKYLSEEELESLCDPNTYLGQASKLVERAVDYARRVIGS
jgi:adenylosuccinate lyase